MILVDTSVWLEIFRDKTGRAKKAFQKKIGAPYYVLSRFNQLELLQGARDEKEWELLEDYLSNQYYLEAFIKPAIKYTNKNFPSCHSREGGNPGNTMSYGFRLFPRIKSGVRPE